MRRLATQGKRLRCALAALAAALALALSVDVVLDLGEPGVASEVGRAALADMVSGGSASAESETPVEAPDRFEDEVVSLVGRGDVHVGARGRVVGFCCDKSPEAAFLEVAGILEGRGWTAVESGLAASGSFVKEEGAYTWAFVSCVQSGSATSVVVQCEAQDEG